MAKNFPYFKFIATEWLTGDIVFEPLEAQGLFINVCALYWQRNGDLSVTDVNKRYRKPIALQLLSDSYLVVKDEKISIEFLDEQLVEANHISKVRSDIGKKGGRPKALQTLENKPIANQTKPIDKQTKANKNKNKNKNKNIGAPELIEFLSYCKSIKEINFSDMEFSLKSKYETWIESGWKDGNNNPIVNWKNKVKNTIPYLKPMKPIQNNEHIKTTLNFGKGVSNGNN